MHSQEKYLELQNLVTKENLFARVYWYYVYLFFLILAGFVLCIYIITVTDNLFVQILNAFFLSFLGVQSGMLGHDLSHQQVFKSKFWNSFWAFWVWGCLCGLSEERWFVTHNAHHKEVNHFGSDPDIDFPFFHSDVQSQNNQNIFIKKFVTPYQHIIFFLVLPLAYFSYIQNSIRYAFRTLNLKNLAELALFVGRDILLIYIAVYYLPILVAIVFLLVHAYTAGYYMGLVFAPNHKGMEIIPANEKINWTHQITLTRNIFPGNKVFHFMGGLNYQIEHHLFSTMPRLNLPKAAKIVKKFCKENNLTYYETTWWGSMREIYFSLKSHSKNI